MDKRRDSANSGRTCTVMGMRVDVASLERATEQLIDIAEAGAEGYVCAANVHMCMEAHDDEQFQRIVNNASLVVPDGKPLVWWMWAFGISAAQQVRGPDLFLSVSHAASAHGIPVALYGGTPEVLSRLQEFLKIQYPKFRLAKAISPPFRALSEDEEWGYIDEINRSGARIVFVGLGCPKQEKWMALNEKRVAAVMIGVGAAFDFYAGTKKIAPEWVRKSGFEWLHRLLNEPGRLWRRYLWNNPRFIYHFLAEWTGRYLRALKR